MAARTYTDQLKDPRWQRKRLEVMQRADFSCEDCYSTDETLHIHHTYYEKGLLPWEYPDQSLRCLCEECHLAIQHSALLLQRQIGRMSNSHLDMLVGLAYALEWLHTRTGTFHLASMGMEYGFSLGSGIPEEMIRQVTTEGTLDGHALFERWQRTAKPRRKRA